VLDGPHFEEPPVASVPSRFPITTSPRRFVRIAGEKNPAPSSFDATIAMSPTQAIEIDRQPEPARDGAATATAHSAATATSAACLMDTTWLRHSYEYDTHAPAGRS
jgi:hypothetical protein